MGDEFQKKVLTDEQVGAGKCKNKQEELESQTLEIFNSGYLMYLYVIFLLLKCDL